MFCTKCVRVSYDVHNSKWLAVCNEDKTCLFSYTAEIKILNIVQFNLKLKNVNTTIGIFVILFFRAQFESFLCAVRRIEIQLRADF